ncbi:Putative ribonuclease H-like superfamily [Septoria linicola]|uniref:Ribonuclease H-like superfamily n=1 Tax=Septoria linicola TaxID=215465 RepID=A0A9Q9AJK5_9PEZI|nr:putative ribonuclease H-like superfamily [Septoria linicola]USW50542.1 Putative ribonuclease H-like superfamily [Septoria linicola]
MTRRPAPGSYQAWRKCWIGGPKAVRRALRKSYKNNFAVCRIVRMMPYQQAGDISLQEFAAAFGSNPSSPDTDIVLLAMDFEGTTIHKGINEVGLASISSAAARSYSSSLPTRASNFALKNHRRRKFMHGNTTRITNEMLPGTILSEVSSLAHDPSGRPIKIILVAHGIMNEVRNLDSLGLYIEDLPIAGVVDTTKLFPAVLGARCGSLWHLLDMLSIPMGQTSLHCAGNDAHYTLQAVLALLDLQFRDGCGVLGEIARRAAPRPPSWNKEEVVDYLEFPLDFPEDVAWEESEGSHSGQH